MTLLAVAATTLLVLVFVQSARHKVSDFTSFSGYLADYRLLPDMLVGPVGVLLACAESFVAVGLLVPPWSAIAAVAAIALLALYAASMALNLARGRREIACGCGGAVQHISPTLIVRNVVLAVAAATVVLQPPAAVGVGGAVAGLAVGLLAWLLLEAAEQIVANSAVASRLKRL